MTISAGEVSLELPERSRFDGPLSDQEGTLGPVNHPVSANDLRRTLRDWKRRPFEAHLFRLHQKIR